METVPARIYKKTLLRLKTRLLALEKRGKKITIAEMIDRMEKNYKDNLD